jgi:hypothetical protein
LIGVLTVTNESPWGRNKHMSKTDAIIGIVIGIGYWSYWAGSLNMRPFLVESRWIDRAPSTVPHRKGAATGEHISGRNITVLNEYGESQHNRQIIGKLSTNAK